MRKKTKMILLTFSMIIVAITALVLYRTNRENTFIGPDYGYIQQVNNDELIIRNKNGILEMQKGDAWISIYEDKTGSLLEEISDGTYAKVIANTKTAVGGDAGVYDVTITKVKSITGITENEATDDPR